MNTDQRRNLVRQQYREGWLEQNILTYHELESDFFGRNVAKNELDKIHSESQVAKILQQQSDNI